MVDLLPAQSQGWQKVESIAQDHFGRAGLQEIRTPIIEQTELFLRGIGENTDVVGKEMYSFDDRGGRSCTLRPEGTASVARSIVQHGLLKVSGGRVRDGANLIVLILVLHLLTTHFSHFFLFF